MLLVDYYEERSPALNDFITGKFFGTRFVSWEELTYAVNVRMMECKYIEGNTAIQKVGGVALIQKFRQDGHAYDNTIDELLQHYTKELPIRIEKSKNAEKFPGLAIVSKHLVEMKHIIQL